MDTAEAPMRPSVARAWLVGHEGRATGVAMVVLAVVLSVGAQWLLPIPGHERKVPFWQLTPAVLAMVASLATVNRLPSGHAGPQRLARGAWACCVVAAAGMCSWVVGLGSAHLPSLVPGTTVVVALTFGVATVTGRSSVWVGTVLALVVLSRLVQMSDFEDLWASLPATTRLAAATVAVVGLAGYSWFPQWQPRQKD